MFYHTFDKVKKWGDLYSFPIKVREATEDNCIPLCFDCHVEVKQYNPKHLKGLKYTEGELKLRRD